MKYGFLKNHPQTVNTARVYYYRIEWNLDALIVRRCVKTTVRVNYFPLQLFNAHSSFSVIHSFLCSFLLQLFNFYAHSKFQRNFSSKCQTRNDACIFGCTQKKVKRFFFFCHRNTKIFIFFLLLLCSHQARVVNYLSLIPLSTFFKIYDHDP